MTEVKVTQADRDAVKAFHAESFRLLLETKPDSSINAAHHALCEAFARHRHAAMIEGARLMQNKAKMMVEIAAFRTDPDHPPHDIWTHGFESGRDAFAVVIAALDPAEVVKGQP